MNILMIIPKCYFLLFPLIPYDISNDLYVDALVKAVSSCATIVICKLLTLDAYGLSKSFVVL